MEIIVCFGLAEVTARNGLVEIIVRFGLVEIIAPVGLAEMKCLARKSYRIMFLTSV